MRICLCAFMRSARKKWIHLKCGDGGRVPCPKVEASDPNFMVPYLLLASGGGPDPNSDVAV